MLFAMFAMVVLTLLVGLFTLSSRMKSVKAGEVKARYYKLMQGQELPEYVAKTGRNFNNQFEVPVLFYAAAILHIVMQAESGLGLILAWVFVVLRYVHAFIHITYNHILHRMLVFFASFFVVVAMWGNLLVVAM